MWDPNITQRVLAAIDKSEDPHLAIDILRQEDERQSSMLLKLEKRIVLLEEAERDRITKTGVWTIVKSKLEEETVDWVKWAVRGCLGALFAALVSGAGWAIVEIYKGLKP